MAKAVGGSPRAGDVFDLARIRDLIALMEESNLSEVDLRQDEQQIRLVRGGVAATPAIQPAAMPVASVAVPAAVAAPTAAVDGAHIKVIKSPMVGTFYTRSSPKAEDFVKVGSRVSVDTVVCIVEAMKVFNEIPAEISGTIVEILARNEDAVDFDRPLFKVDTRG
ncbi:MAG: acetyl-CoA carboxylase biotin carboxyl carrier protein [Aureliella sp.]